MARSYRGALRTTLYYTASVYYITPYYSTTVYHAATIQKVDASFGAPIEEIFSPPPVSACALYYTTTVYTILLLFCHVVTIQAVEGSFGAPHDNILLHHITSCMPVTIPRPAATFQAVEGSFGVPIEELFEDFREAPLASGSIGQVHFTTTIYSTKLLYATTITALLHAPRLASPLP